MADIIKDEVFGELKCYIGSFYRLASLLVLIPAFILLWQTVGNISILGVLVMYFGKVIFQWDKYQQYT